MIRPLRRVRHGVWRSRDERWTFCRHEGDNCLNRWMAYLDGEPEPVNIGYEPDRLNDLVEWAERQCADDDDDEGP